MLIFKIWASSMFFSLFCRPWYIIKSFGFLHLIYPWVRWPWVRSITWSPLKPISSCGSCSSVPIYGPCLFRSINKSKILLGWGNNKKLSVFKFVRFFIWKANVIPRKYGMLIYGGWQRFPEKVCVLLKVWWLFLVKSVLGPLCNFM